jgi:hypothetical protein
MPSEEEIGELLSKASEYVSSYRQTFTNAKPSLDKVPTPGFYEKGMELSTQAGRAIIRIRLLLCLLDYNSHRVIDRHLTLSDLRGQLL